MVSRNKHKKTSFYKKLQLLRSITNSYPRCGTSINILDASNCIQGLMGKVEKKNRQTHDDDDDVGSQSSTPTAAPNSTLIFPVVKVESQALGGFVIKVVTERSCPGLLVFILEAFEELGLDVLQARASCSHNFHLEAVAIIDNQQNTTGQKDSQAVEQAMFHAIQRWTEVTQLE